MASGGVIIQTPEEYMAKFRPNYVTLFSQLIIYLCSSLGNMRPLPKWMPHHSLDLQHIDL
jgi:hypothetical protein